MRFAVFLENINFEHLDPRVRRVFLFEREEEVITAVGEELLTLYDLNYLLLWLLGKNVKQIYVNGIDSMFKWKVEYIGIIVSELKDLKDNPLKQNSNEHP